MVFSIYMLLGPTGKYYIGQTRNSLAWRWRHHYEDAEYGKKHGHLQAAIRRYGRTAFEKFTLFKVSSQEEANRAETQMIRALRATDPRVGYNLDPSARGGPRSPETCRKIGLKHKGKKMSPDARARMKGPRPHIRVWNKGLKFPYAPRPAYPPTNGNKGKKRTPAQLRRLANAHLGQIPWNKKYFTISEKREAVRQEKRRWYLRRKGEKS